MRSIVLIAFLAFPTFAQSPSTREIAFKCDEDYCALSRADWQWVMESMKAKDQLLSKCGWKSTQLTPRVN